jgi:hypothetical protein
MKDDEFFYRSSHDWGIPCPKCERKINALELVVMDNMLRDGRPTNCCPHCKEEIEILRWRTYGQKSPRSYQYSFIPGYPEQNNHWTVGGRYKRMPLWAIGNGE